ncbi:MAG: carboxypeptidase regulatory-like domain-containing protein [Sandaracinaceae bacterium]|nr:MAG: carboxypeptidase regulatory-like domain-containing protein [Sandaracinaceae bacterium]
MKSQTAFVWLALLTCAGVAQAQEGLPPGHPPTGQPPADQGLPPGHPPAGGGQQAPAGDAQRVSQALRPPTLATAAPSADVPVGSIRVRVVDANDRPVAGATVDVGSLAQGERSRHNGETNADGVFVFEDLPTGSGQAYRVNVPFNGALYSSDPFQLPTDRGFDVTMTRLPVTRDPRFTFFHVFRVIVEQRGERLHVIHQAQLTNAGSETFVFPSEGARAELPEGATAFQFQRVIGDQRVEEIPDANAYAFRGSMPPGTIQLAWAYDLPVDGESLDIPVEIPLRFFALQVLGEALPGLQMDVDGMPAPRRLDPEGAPCESSQRTEGCAWVTMERRGPEQAELRSIVIELSGIPGPPNIRWVAVLVALAFAFFGIAWATVRPRIDPRAEKRARRKRRQALLDEVRALEEELGAGEIGPEYHAKRRAALERELAVLLYREDRDAEADEDEAEEDAAPSPRRTGAWGLSFVAGAVMTYGGASGMLQFRNLEGSSWVVAAFGILLVVMAIVRWTAERRR